MVLQHVVIFTVFSHCESSTYTVVQALLSWSADQQDKPQEKPQPQNITKMMEDYKSGACKLKEAQELAAIQAETLKQQNENQKLINEQLAEIQQQMAELKNNNSGSSGPTPPKRSRSTLMRAADYNDDINSLQYDDEWEDRSTSEDELDDKEDKSDSENFSFDKTYSVKLPVEQRQIDLWNNAREWTQH